MTRSGTVRGTDPGTPANGVPAVGSGGTAATKLQGLWERHADGSATADAVYATLRDAIISGHLQAGDRLSEQQLAENYAAALDEILRLKPSSAKGRYIKKIAVSTTMGPGIPVDPNRTRNVTVDDGA